MTNPREAFRRGARAVFAAALLVLAAACGPGTGGTGTGPSGSFFFVGSPSAVGAPSGPVTACQVTCGRLDLRVEPERVELVADCRRFVFVGSWEADASGLALLNGTLEVQGAGSPAGVPATLRLQFGDRSATPAQATVSIADGAGAVLLGPVILQRGTGQLVACPAT